MHLCSIYTFYEFICMWNKQNFYGNIIFLNILIAFLCKSECIVNLSFDEMYFTTTKYIENWNITWLTKISTSFIYNETTETQTHKFSIKTVSLYFQISSKLITQNLDDIYLSNSNKTVKYKLQLWWQ